MGDFSLQRTPLPGLMLVTRSRRTDSRGYFSRLFCADELTGVGFDGAVSQVNQTLTIRRGSVRGMHFQRPPHAEVKFVSVLKGSVFDVAVDLRRGSPTFLKWHGEVLSNENARSLLIPRGFAHGFQALSDDCELLYLHSCAYAPLAEGALNVADPALGIDWPLPIAEISARDRAHEFLSPDFQGLSL